MDFLIWLKSTPLAEWVLYSPWANPILLCMHASGMALVVGCGLMTSLRILGYARSVPLSLFERLIAFAWAGVALNAVSGLLLFMSDGDRYIGNWTFQLKIGFIFLAGIATWFLWRILLEEGGTRSGVQLDPENIADSANTIAGGPVGRDIAAQAEAFSPRARTAAAITALFWICAIIAGRMIAYTLAPGFE
ncbi:MAG: hypothetical protein P0Y59_05565 [Candidatus Sphingomonas phytovorans]|nr:hypothetical protein [Sphingomonas sp.]WEK01157.1 MAG: hypothetical protein P0Y59_05565 [Sphingomonas sp.]